MKKLFSSIFMIGILATMAVVGAVNIVPEAEAFEKGQGVHNSKYGSATKAIVCGDMLCSEKYPNETPQKKMMVESEKVKTPMKETSTKPSLIGTTTGATVLNTAIDSQSDMISVSIDAYDDGKMTINLPSILSEIYMVLVDGEEWDSAYINEDKLDVYFYAGTEKIEIFGNISG